MVTPHALKITTHYDPPPVSGRQFDWSAYVTDEYDGEGSSLGYGPTEAEAIADLLEQIEERLTGERPSEFREALAKATGEP